MSQAKKPKIDRGIPFSEAENKRLIALYLENKENYHEKFRSGSKSGESKRQKLLADWSVELTNMGYAYRSKESIEEKIRNETKKVQRFLRDEKDKFKGTGGGVYVLKKLAPYLHPLADALAEKHNVGGIPGIEDASGEEDVAITMDDAEQDAVSDEAVEADAVASTDPGPSQGSQESSRPSQASAPTPSQHSQASAPTPSRHRSMTATAREALSLFSDKRTQLYEEEIKVARMKQKKLQVEIQVAELKKEEAKFLVEAARARYNATNPTSPTSRPSTAEATSPTSKYMRYYNI